MLSGLRGLSRAPAPLAARGGRRSPSLTKVGNRHIKTTKVRYMPSVVFLLICLAPKSRIGTRASRVLGREGLATAAYCSASDRPPGGSVALPAVFIFRAHTAATHAVARHVCRTRRGGQICRNPSSRRRGRYYIYCIFRLAKHCVALAAASVAEG